MNPQEIPRECAVCHEQPPSITHGVYKNRVLQRLCTDCMLRKFSGAFCNVCLTVFDSNAHISCVVICTECITSRTHLSCLPPEPIFTCPLCSDPNFTYLPQPSYLNEPISVYSGKAILAASNLSVNNMNQVAFELKQETVLKISEALNAKMNAESAFQNFQNLVNWFR